MPKNETTDRQRQILEVIRQFTVERGYPPSVREIGERVGLASPSTVQLHLRTLESLGLLRRDPSRPRALTIAEDIGEVVRVHLLGKVAAGLPITAVENIEETMILPTTIARDASCFALRVSGDSMIEAGIYNDDLIIVHPCKDAQDGQIIVALIGEETTVKHIYRIGGRIKLQPANRAMNPLWFDDITIIGKVEAVIRKLK